MEVQHVRRLCEKIIPGGGPLKIQPVLKGWSEEKKFLVEIRAGSRYMLRISPISSLEKREKEFKIMEKIKELGITMSLPLEMGQCGDNKNVYVLLSWVEGEALDEGIKNLEEEEQYFLGLKAGETLKKIHVIPGPDNLENWEGRMGRKIKDRLEKYRSSDLKVKNDQYVIDFIQENIHLLKGRPQVLQHGDYHTGNLVLTPEGDLGVIDFNRGDYGDPFEDFLKMEMFSRELSIFFCRGQLDGYFSRGIPENLFPLLALYLASVALFSPVWAEPFGEKEIASMTGRAERIIKDYNNFRRVTPRWLNRREIKS